MAVDYKVEIEFIPKGEGSINNVTLPNGNNVSKFNGGTYIGSAISSPNNGANPFILGVSRLGTVEQGGDGAVFANEYKGYMSSIMADSQGNCDFTMTISGTNIDNFTIYFDSVVNQFATMIKVNDIDYTNDDTQFTWRTDTPTNEIIVNFTHWSKPYYNIRFTSISIGLTLTYTQFTGLLSFVRGSQSMKDNSLPSYGALAQYGSVKLADFNGEINDLEEMGALHSGLKVKMFVDGEQIGDYLFDTFSKDDINTYNIELTDEIVKWNDILVDNKELEFNKTAYDFYMYLKGLYSAEYEELSTDMTNYLNSVKIAYYYLNKGSLFEQWNKFCDITQMLVYKKQNGKIALRRLQ